MSQLIIRAVPVLDQLAQRLAWGLGKVLPTVRGAGLFWVSGGSFFSDAWREPWAWTLRLGRVELVVDVVCR